MSRRVLYILIIVLVLAVAIFVLRPMLTRKPAAEKSASTAVKGARGKKGAATDTGAVAAKSSKGKEKVKAAKGKAAKEAAAKEAEAAKEAAPATKPAAAEVKEAPALKDTTPLLWLADPFVRDWMLAGELRDMKLRAVTVGEKSLALINDRIVALGDTVSGKRLVSITRDSVVFEFGGQRRSLKIGE